MKKDIIVHVGYVEKSKTKSLHAAFEEGIALMERHIHFGASTFVTPFMKEREVNLANIWNRIRTIKSLLMTGDDEQAYELIHNIVRELQENHISLKQLNLLIQSIYYALLYEMQESFDIDGIHEDFQFIQKISSYQELEDYLEAMISQLKLINTTVELQPKHLVPKVLEWIHDNYDQSIVFQQFAYNHHVSLSYLSREFKAQTGYTFSEYLMMYRIQKAKEFITRGVKKIKEVASLVGYEDPKHFTSVFKRITGETPQQFRENLKL